MRDAQFSSSHQLLTSGMNSVASATTFFRFTLIVSQERGERKRFTICGLWKALTRKGWVRHILGECYNAARGYQRISGRNLKKQSPACVFSQGNSFL